MTFYHDIMLHVVVFFNFPYFFQNGYEKTNIWRKNNENDFLQSAALPKIDICCSHFKSEKIT